MKLSENKLRKVIREEVKRVISERGEYSQTGFHGGSQKTTWSELGDGSGVWTIVGKTISKLDRMPGEDFVEIHFQDGTTIEFFTDEQVFLSRP